MKNINDYEYFVFVEGGGVPGVAHSHPKEAVKQAKKLVIKLNKPAYVLACISKTEPILIDGELKAKTKEFKSPFKKAKERKELADKEEEQKQQLQYEKGIKIDI